MEDSAEIRRAESMCGMLRIRIGERKRLQSPGRWITAAGKRIRIKDPIATGHTELNIRKEASASAPILYNTGRVSNYAFLILEETGGFYKIQSDPVLTGDRSRTDPNTGVYNSGAMYAYVSRDYVRPVSGKVPDTAPSPSPPPSSSSMLTYNSHVQTHGWMGYIPEGEISGTSGEAKRLEAIRIRLNNPDYEGSVEYCTHVQTYGWQEWKSDDAVSGTQGEAKRMEADRRDGGELRYLLSYACSDLWLVRLGEERRDSRKYGRVEANGSAAD